LLRKGVAAVVHEGHPTIEVQIDPVLVLRRQRVIVGHDLPGWLKRIELSGCSWTF
jgi:hypothetical protein